MPDFRHVSEPDLDAATVRIFRASEAIVAAVTWPALGKPSALVGPTVGARLLPAVALDAVSAAVDRGVVPDAVVMIEDEALWDKRWGRLV